MHKFRLARVPKRKKRSKKPFIASIAIAVLAFTSGTGVHDWLDVQYLSQSRFKLTLESKEVRVIDGDTIALENGIRIRLKGIDAPEMKQECKSHAEVDTSILCGVEAKTKLEELIGDSIVKCTDEGLDVYQRQLSYCYSVNDLTNNPINLNLELVRLGYAQAYRHQNTYLTLQEYKARDYKQGLWQTDFQAPWEWRKAQKLQRKALHSN